MAEKLSKSMEDAVMDKHKLKSDEKSLGSKVSLGNKGMYMRVDKIDFKSWDIQLEKHLSKVLSREKEKQKQNQKRKEQWQIDSSKLDIRHVMTAKTLQNATATAVLRASFQQEAAVWQKLIHPNVTKFVGASMETSYIKIPAEDISSEVHTSLSAQPYCVVEYVPGGTLKKFLIRNRRKKLAFKVVIQLALDLSRGLSYLHSKRIVHRDVKTENMLLDARRTVKIADFGVARIEAENPKDMTGETGTLGYMAPEVLDGKPYNRKCDVYSFGICLWEIYCCDMPYTNLSFADVSCGVVRQNLRPEVPRCCPSSLASIMRKCWDTNPDKRPEMDEVVRLLEAIDTSKGGGMIPEDQVTGCWCFGPGRGP